MGLAQSCQSDPQKDQTEAYAQIERVGDQILLKIEKNNSSQNQQIQTLQYLKNQNEQEVGLPNTNIVNKQQGQSQIQMAQFQKSILDSPGQGIEGQGLDQNQQQLDHVAKVKAYKNMRHLNSLTDSTFNQMKFQASLNQSRVKVDNLEQSQIVKGQHEHSNAYNQKNQINNQSFDDVNFNLYNRRRYNFQQELEKKDKNMQNKIKSEEKTGDLFNNEEEIQKQNQVSNRIHQKELDSLLKQKNSQHNTSQQNQDQNQKYSFSKNQEYCEKNDKFLGNNELLEFDDEDDKQTQGESQYQNKIISEIKNDYSKDDSPIKKINMQQYLNKNEKYNQSYHFAQQIDFQQQLYQSQGSKQNQKLNNNGTVSDFIILNDKPTDLHQSQAKIYQQNIVQYIPSQMQEKIVESKKFQNLQRQAKSQNYNDKNIQFSAHPSLKQTLVQFNEIDIQNGENNTYLYQSQQLNTDQEIRQIKENELYYAKEIYEDGSEYQGYKINDKKHGKGTFYYSQGGKYEGQWKDDKICGFGTLYYPSGQKAYEGEWKEDQFCGQGTVFNENQKQLEQLRQSQQQIGNFFDYRNFNTLGENWIKYEGQFKKDFKDGQGTLYLNTGEKYVGKFSFDYVHGQGKFYKGDGEVIQGVWRINELKQQY